MTAGKGLLLVMMEPPACLEEEFNDWYDTEHLPQRRSLLGFESASRYVCLSGWPKWLALYDLASPRTLETSDYRAVSGANSTPWSKRILPRTIGRSRVIAEQIAPGDKLSRPLDEVSNLLVARYPSTGLDRFLAGLQKAAADLIGLSQHRLFRTAGHPNADLWLIAEFNRPAAQEMLRDRLSEIGGSGARLFNLYTPYHRG
jgi:hypothetical protein